MARVKYSPIISFISGSIGSATFQRSLYGNTLRLKPLPKKQASSIQLVRRVIMMELHEAWAAMSDAQHKQWHQFVLYSSSTINKDSSVRISGYALFIKYNFLRILSMPYWYDSLEIFLPNILLDIKYIPLPSWPRIYQISVWNHYPLIQFANEWDPFNIYCTWKVSDAVKPGNTFFKRRLKTQIGIYQQTMTIHPTLTWLQQFGLEPVNHVSTINYEVQYFHLYSPYISGKITGTCILDTPFF